ncbi:unnamed protein product [Mytilus edulis]|uniref:C2H2-type domain-containing protein n=1 Tax=Mytilus edulis TaxID=6550 RepID=A0A8S3RQS6_MYTED|nr:unnamed protein product [Mytilus edulis]
MRMTTSYEKRPKYSSHYVETILELIESDVIEDDDLIRLVSMIGKKKRHSLISDGNRASQHYENDDFFENYQPDKWLNEQNKVIIEFMKSLCGIDSFSLDNRKTLYFVKLTEFISNRINAIWAEPDLVRDNLSSESTVYRKAEVEKSFDKYQFINDTCSKQPSSLVLGDPIMKNPCSYTSVKHVLTRIIETTCGSRQWLIAGCDGSPYILGSRLMDKSFTCKHCNCDYTNKSAFQKHIKESHHECDINESRTFGKLLLVPRLGHIEINMAKGCFKLLWHVFLKELGNMLGFRTIRAQTCCQMATDHHKAMQMIEIALFGFADELIFKYCEFCKLNKVSPSVQEYFGWFADLKKRKFPLYF